MMNALFENRDAAGAAADKLKVFAQPLRLMILSCLLRGERNVGEIAELTGIGQPALSQQLGELRRAELVLTRKEAKQVWYTLANDGVALCVRNMEAIFGGIGTPEEPPVRAAPRAEPSADPAPASPAPPPGAAGFARVIRG